MTIARNQIPLDLMMSIPVFAGINSANSITTAPDDCCAAFTSCSPELALSSMVVDDRALHLGKTTWKNLLDVAIATGHIEIYDAEPGAVGLRKPGMRFGPVNCIPDIGVGYVRERVAALKRKSRAR